ncbi:YdcF family protein [Hathewaya histolytica]|uniref:YdcF family protein n=1 Tax=Hathewaya histolytica TaxID=1498 RepID=UPI003B684230
MRFSMRKSNFVLFLLGILSIVYFFTLKFFGPIAFSKFWIILGAILIILSIGRENRQNYYKNQKGCKGSSYNERRGVFKRLITALFILFFSFFIILEGFIIYNGEVVDKEKVDIVIVLGAGLKGRKLSQSLHQRMDMALTYLRDNPDMRVIVSGGKGPGEDITESEAMEEYLIENGIAKDRIVKESKSRNTFQNFKFSREKLNNIGEQDKKKVLIITNNFHMLRSKMLAKRNGFEPYGLPAELHPYIKPNFYVREFFGLIKSFLFDKDY